MSEWKHTKEEWIEMSTKIHGVKYDYSDMWVNTYYRVNNYRTYLEDVRCRECNTLFRVRSDSHTGVNYRSGCPTCSKSKGEKLAREYFLDNDHCIEYEKKFIGLRGLKGGHLRVDAYDSLNDIAFEFDGPQHRKPVEMFGGEESLSMVQAHDQIKDEYFKTKPTTLIRIPIDNDVSKVPFLLQDVYSKLGYVKKLPTLSNYL